MSEQLINDDDQDFEKIEHPLDSTEESKLIRKKGKDPVIDLMDPRSVEKLGIEEWALRFDIAFRKHYEDRRSIVEWAEQERGRIGVRDYYTDTAKPNSEKHAAQIEAERNSRIPLEDPIDIKNNLGKRPQVKGKSAISIPDTSEMDKMTLLRQMHSIKLSPSAMVETLESIRRMVANTQGDNITVEEGIELIDCLSEANLNEHLEENFRIESIKNRFFTYSELVTHYKTKIIELKDELIFGLIRFEIESDEFGIPNIDLVVDEIQQFNSRILDMQSIFNDEIKFKVIITYLEKIINENLDALITQVTDGKLLEDLERFNEEYPTKYPLRMKEMQQTSPKLFNYIFRNFLNSNPLG